MALDDLLISTGVDQLIKLIKEQGKVEIGAAAKELSQPIRTIEDWAHVLEEEGLVKIDYKLTKIYLVWQQPSREYVAQKSEKLGQKATRAEQEVSMLLSKVERGGEELAEIETGLAKLKSVSAYSPDEAGRLKKELAALETEYGAAFKSAAAKIAALEKKLVALKPAAEGAAQKSGALDEMQHELASLSKYEQTLQAQIDETDTFFEAFQTRLEEFRGRVEENRSDEKLGELKAELESTRALFGEIKGAVEAIEEEQASISGKFFAIEKKAAALANREDSVFGAKKKLAEIRRLADDAKKQRKNITGQLSDTLSLVRKQISKMKEIGDRQAKAQGALQKLKDEYVDISEEISRANEELAARRTGVFKRIEQQAKALDGAGEGRISKDDVEKVSLLFEQLSREQARMEGKLRALSREAGILKLERDGAGARQTGNAAQTAKPAAQARTPVVPPQIAARTREIQPAGQENLPSGAPTQPGGSPPEREGEQASITFVDKVELTRDEESEFEHKRDELRSLIRKMWEESKGGS